MARSKIIPLLGLAAAGGGAYYYYNVAGGNVSAAQAQFDRDRHRAQDNAQATYDSIKASANSATDLGKHKLEEAQAKIDAERKKAQAEIQKTIDDADRKVQDQAAKAKGWFSK